MVFKALRLGEILKWMSDLCSIYIEERLDPRTELCDFKIERSRAEAGKLWPVGQICLQLIFIQPTRMVFTYFKG